MNAARAPAAATANIVVNEQLTAAESAVAQAASHLELMRKLAGQALCRRSIMCLHGRARIARKLNNHTGLKVMSFRLDSSMPRIF